MQSTTLVIYVTSTVTIGLGLTKAAPQAGTRKGPRFPGAFLPEILKAYLAWGFTPGCRATIRCRRLWKRPSGMMLFVARKALDR